MYLAKESKKKIDYPLSVVPQFHDFVNEYYELHKKELGRDYLSPTKMVELVFLEWVQKGKHRSEKADKLMNDIRDSRSGRTKGSKKAPTP